VNTGIDGGTVNLRACPGAACGRVLDILTEGASLTIVSTGESTGYASLYVNVETAGGVAGWLNKKYCEVK
jgi:hypothetical protein